LEAGGYRRRKKLQSAKKKNPGKGVTMRFIHAPVKGKSLYRPG